MNLEAGSINRVACTVGMSYRFSTFLALPPLVIKSPCNEPLMKNGGVCHFGVKELNFPDIEEAEIQ